MVHDARLCIAPFVSGDCVAPFLWSVDNPPLWKRCCEGGGGGGGSGGGNDNFQHLTMI